MNDKKAYNKYIIETKILLKFLKKIIINVTNTIIIVKVPIAPKTSSRYIYIYITTVYNKRASKVPIDAISKFHRKCVSRTDLIIVAVISKINMINMIYHILSKDSIPALDFVKLRKVVTYAIKNLPRK